MGAASKPKQEWTFEANVSSADIRQARALEHIAQYLSLIETHLAAIAAQSVNGGNIAMAIDNGLKGIAAQIDKVAR